MRRLRPFLLGVAVLYLVMIGLGAFLLHEPLPPWGAFLMWLVAGLLLASAVRPSRWWVALGFLWLGAAWVEAGQAVWLERAGSVTDVLFNCAASAIGVGIAVLVRLLLRIRSVTARTASARPAGAPRRR